MIPSLAALISQPGKVRLLCFMDEEFAGFEAGAMWDDAKFFLPHQDDFEKLAIVGYVYRAAGSAARQPADYTARVIPHCDGVAIPLEDARILWQR